MKNEPLKGTFYRNFRFQMDHVCDRQSLNTRGFAMNIKMICMGALALATISGSALAASDSSELTPGAAPDAVLSDPVKMAPFYTDSTMKTMRSEDEFKAAWMAMSKEDQTEASKGCNDEVIAKAHNDFCTLAMKHGGGK